MRIPVVNKRDEIIGHKDRNDRNPEDIIRVSGVWVINSRQEVLIAQLSPQKKYNAGKWGPSVGGTVEEGETYLVNALKELSEEIGINATEQDLTEGVHRISDQGTFFCQVYFYKTDTLANEFVLQEDEVAQLRWISIGDLKEWYRNTPQDFIESFEGTLRDVEEYLTPFR